MKLDPEMTLWKPSIEEQLWMIMAANIHRNEYLLISELHSGKKLFKCCYKESWELTDVACRSR